MSTLAVILAAGKGTRMESDLPKVLVPACGRPLIEYVLDAVHQAGVEHSLVVVGYRGEDVQAALADRKDITFVEQTEQLGTGHAVKTCLPQLEQHDGAVMVLTGDSPMTQTQSLQQLLSLYEREHPACILGSLIKDDPTGLGRIVRDSSGEFLGIAEQKDATPEQLAVKEVNMSTYVFNGPRLVHALGQLSNDNQQGEYYITDCPGIMREQGLDVRALPVLQPCESLSVNNMDDLHIVEAEMRRMNMV